MRALLLSAGVGSRLRPLTDVLPKCLMPIAGKPLLGHWFDLLPAAEFDQILVNIHHHSDQVAAYIGSRPDATRIQWVKETELLGTAGTALANRAFFGNQPFMLAHADNLTAFDCAAFVKAHRDRPKNCAITMMTFETDLPETCGIVSPDSNGIVHEFFEKQKNPPGNLANAAVYILEPEVLDYAASFGKAFVDFSTEIIPHYLGRISTFHNGTYHRDIGNLQSFLLAQLEYPYAVSPQTSKDRPPEAFWQKLRSTLGTLSK